MGLELWFWLWLWELALTDLIPCSIWSPCFLSLAKQIFLINLHLYLKQCSKVQPLLLSWTNMKRSKDFFIIREHLPPVLSPLQPALPPFLLVFLFCSCAPKSPRLCPHPESGEVEGEMNCLGLRGAKLGSDRPRFEPTLFHFSRWNLEQETWFKHLSLDLNISVLATRTAPTPRRCYKD